MCCLLVSPNFQKQKEQKARVPDQNGVSQAWYIVEIHHSGWEPSKWVFLDAQNISVYDNRHIHAPPPQPPPLWPSGKASASRAEDPGFESCLCRDFFGSSHTSDLKIGTPVATLPGAWCYRVSAGTGQPSVSILWLGEMESLVCNFYLSVAARKIVWADPSLRYTHMLLGR